MLFQSPVHTAGSREGFRTSDQCGKTPGQPEVQNLGEDAGDSPIQWALTARHTHTHTHTDTHTHTHTHNQQSVSTVLTYRGNRTGFQLTVLHASQTAHKPCNRVK